MAKGERVDAREGILESMRGAVVGVLLGVWLTSCLELSDAETPGTGGQAGSGGTGVGGAGGWATGGGAGDSAADAIASDADSGGTGGTTAACVTYQDCSPSQFCAARSALGLVGAGNVCTQGCCTSAQCPTDSVCRATGSGFNACVAAIAVGVGSLGTKASGAICSTGSECRSGSCVSGRCEDACCADSDCATGSTCRFDSVTGSSKKAFVCAAKVGGGEAFAACKTGPDCKSGLCAGKGYCTPPCCGSASCFSPAQTCAYAQTQAGDRLRVCVEVAPGSKPIGASCTAPSECAGGYCIASTMTCSAACCTDADCGDTTKLACRLQPLPTSGSGLLCVLL